jgi:hypothetical protein
MLRAGLLFLSRRQDRLSECGPGGVGLTQLSDRLSIPYPLICHVEGSKGSKRPEKRLWLRHDSVAREARAILDMRTTAGGRRAGGRGKTAGGREQRAGGRGKTAGGREQTAGGRRETEIVRRRLHRGVTGAAAGAPKAEQTWVSAGRPFTIRRANRPAGPKKKRF